MSQLQGLRVLVIDDEPFMRTTIRAMLRLIDRCVVTDAGDGEEALRLLPEIKPDVVLCDISMEPMSGLQFVERLRGLDDPALRETAVVMVTVHADPRTVQSAGHLKISGYLVKPISARQLSDRLRTIFRDRQPPSPDIGGI